MHFMIRPRIQQGGKEVSMISYLLLLIVISYCPIEWAWNSYVKIKYFFIFLIKKGAPFLKALFYLSVH